MNNPDRKTTGRGSGRPFRLLAVLAALCLTVTTLLSGCGTTESENVSYQTVEDLAGKKAGSLTGTMCDESIEDYMIDMDVLYFNTMADMIEALRSGKIDCFVMDSVLLGPIADANPGVRILDDLLDTYDYGVIFGKSDSGAALRDEFNEWLAQVKEDGTLEEIRNLWDNYKDGEMPVFDPAQLTGDKGTIRLCMTDEDAPMEYVSNGLPTGMSVQVVYQFCEDCGYGLDIDMMAAGSLIAGVAAGKYDCSINCWAITEERQESLNMSDAYYTGGEGVFVYDAQEEESGSFFENMISSFRKTFIVENRWENFLEGIATTLMITVVSLILGTLIGFGLYMWYRQGTKAAELIMKFSCWLIEGMPDVVLMLLLFYVVFGNTKLSGTVISIIGFTMIVCTQVFSMLEAGVRSVDRGQEEAMLALGYKPTQGFFKVIFPQAVAQEFPSYLSATVTLIKGTAIVGYVAVEDLTKVSDVIRSRTFEAFFPLIVTAILYFVLAWLLQSIVKLIQRHFLPGRSERKNVLAGIKTKEDAAEFPSQGQHTEKRAGRN